MQTYPKTLIVRHRRENVKKCSLRGLEKRSDFQMIAYPFRQVPPINGSYVLLVMDGAPELSSADQDKGILLLDSTWRNLPKILRAVERVVPCEKRVLPGNFATAYPRRQEDCQDPQRGLASIEALFIAYQVLERSTTGLLDHYFWKEAFLRANCLDI
jgi:pre-rRNA-processing protein TSR3